MVGGHREDEEGLQRATGCRAFSSSLQRWRSMRSVQTNRFVEKPTRNHRRTLRASRAAQRAQPRTLILPWSHSTTPGSACASAVAGAPSAPDAAGASDAAWPLADPAESVGRSPTVARMHTCDDSVKPCRVDLRAYAYRLGFSVIYA